MADDEYDIGYGIDYLIDQLSDDEDGELEIQQPPIHLSHSTPSAPSVASRSQFIAENVEDNDDGDLFLSLCEELEAEEENRRNGGQVPSDGCIPSTAPASPPPQKAQQPVGPPRVIEIVSTAALELLERDRIAAQKAKDIARERTRSFHLTPAPTSSFSIITSSGAKSVGSIVQQQSKDGPSDMELATAESGVEAFSGLAIKQRTIASMALARSMAGRRFFKLCQLAGQIPPTATEMPGKGDWVTIGVICQKSGPRSSSKGSKYAVWTVSDLNTTKATEYALFIFGACFNEKWMESEGTIIAILNAKLLPGKDGRGFSMSVAEGSQVLKLGMSAHFGHCKSMKKDGNPCNKAINLSQGEYCEYHVTQQFQKAQAKNPIFANYASKSSIYFGNKPGQAPQKPQAPMAKTFLLNGQLVTSSMDESAVKAMHSSAQKKKEDAVMAQPSQELLKMSLQGSRLLAKAQEMNQKAQTPKQPRTAAAPTPAAFAPPASGPVSKSSSFTSPVASSASQSVAKPALTPKASMAPSTPSPTPRASKSVTHPAASSQAKAPPSAPASTCFPSAAQQSQSQPRPLSVPSAGAGTLPLPVVPLALTESAGPSLSQNPSYSGLSSNEESAIARAIRIVKEKGVPDPNSVPVIRASEPVSTSPSAPLFSYSSPSVIPRAISESAKSAGKRKIEQVVMGKLGSLLPGTAEFERLMKRKSSHEDAEDKAIFDGMSSLYDKLAEKEKMAEKMASIMELDVKAVKCDSCKTLLEQPTSLCRSQGHLLTHVQCKKRWFACCSCKRRVTVLAAVMPPRVCPQCGGNSFDRVSMYREAKGPDLQEKVLWRGEEQVNSLRSL